MSNQVEEYTLDEEGNEVLVCDAPVAKPKSGLAARLAQKATEPHVEVAALAGAGKTTCVIEGVKSIKGVSSSMTPSDQQAEVWRAMGAAKHDSVRVSAFSTKITDELKSRIISSGLDSRGVEARGIHGLGVQAVSKRFGRVSADKSKWVVADICAELMGTSVKNTRGTKLHDQIWAVDSLVSLCKQTLTDPTPENLDLLSSRYDVELNGRNEIYELVSLALDKCLIPQNGQITFDDMIWLPLKHDLPIYKVDLQIVDECVPGWTPVLLADGKSTTIQSIVESDEEFVVRSYDTKTGEPKNCRVTAKQKLLNQKPLVKIKVKRLDSSKTNFVICTVDHKVWTSNRGWVEAGKVVIGDEAIVETEAAKSQVGKITSNGRKVLSSIKMGNKLGLGNRGGNPTAFNKVKGGNGRSMTLAEEVLSKELNKEWGEGTWKYQYPVATRKGRQSGYPTCYKMDIAFPEERMGIEVDGASHHSETARKKDAKKDSLLTSLGWRIIRVTNKDAVQDIASVLKKVRELPSVIPVCKNGYCPVPAKVVSVDPVSIRDNYVYDITVEDCHNFYANGILVHNCQDLNRMQQQLMYRSGHRLMFVGDRHQAIMGFAGADSDGMDRMKRELNAISIPLTVTRRCGKNIVKEAQAYVPQYEAHENNPLGLVSRDKYRLDDYRKGVQPGDMILCRTNAPLTSQCFKFIKEGRKAIILGKKIGEGLTSLIQKSRASAVPNLIAWLDDWMAKEIENENAKRNPSENRIDGMKDRYDCILAFCEGLSDVNDVNRKINAIFTDDKDNRAITLSSKHKSKGLESERVFILEPKESIPRLDRMQPWEREQLRNLEYVAITRAIEELYFVK